MELKHLQDGDLAGRSELLIVPYGIETLRLTTIPHNPSLLIVPYGIETPLSASAETGERLLIVPYGIETFIRLFGISCK